MLLRFRVINHRSIRDEAELSLVSSSLKTRTPLDGDWIKATTRVAAIYGANASGKSSLLDAIDYMHAAIISSATEWLTEKRFPRNPFRLDSDSASKDSLFEVDLVAAGVRYIYGFEVNDDGVQKEWLYSYPSGKRRVLFERDASEERVVFFGRTLAGDNSTLARATKPRSLLLSMAEEVEHEALSDIRQAILRGIRYARITDVDRTQRIDWIRKKLAEDAELKAHAEALIRAADLGITKIELVRRKLDAKNRDMLTELHRSLSGISGMDSVPLEEFLDHAELSIKLVHEVEGAKPTAFHLVEESDGTVAWLSLVVPALHALRHGETLLIDEVGASLHPVLTAELIRIFKDPDLNPSGGQLIFTSHDTPLMGNLIGGTLERDEVWFTEKGPDGATALYALEEFSVREGGNFEKRYLEGRFGALPQVQKDEIRAVLLASGM